MNDIIGIDMGGTTTRLRWFGPMQPCGVARGQPQGIAPTDARERGSPGEGLGAMNRAHTESGPMHISSSTVCRGDALCSPSSPGDHVTVNAVHSSWGHRFPTKPDYAAQLAALAESLATAPA